LGEKKLVNDDLVPMAEPQLTLKSSFFDIVQSEVERPLELGTADAGWLSTAADRCQYVLKDKTSKASSQEVPHCEWFCTHVGELLQIPAPQFKIVRKIDGEHVFGSRWAGGIVPTDPNGFWFDRVKTGEIPLKELSGLLSRIYAFDLFVHNLDRHKWNFLLQKQFDAFVLLANDYSRAWIRWGFPLPDVSKVKTENTYLHKKILQDYWQEEYISETEVNNCLFGITSIPKDRIRRIIEDHPDDWLPEVNKNAILDWWGSTEMLARIQTISSGVKNGTLI
jgi:hypothetical protein